MGEAKRPDDSGQPIILPKELQIRMMKFFLKAKAGNKKTKEENRLPEKNGR